MKRLSMAHIRIYINPRTVEHFLITFHLFTRNFQSLCFSIAALNDQRMTILQNFAFPLLLALLSNANPIPAKLVNSPSAAAFVSQSLIQEVYCLANDGRIKVFTKDTVAHLPHPAVVIANGGGGQAGMIEHLASHFLQSARPVLPPDTCIGWWASNTHGSHFAVQEGTADLAVVYDTNRIELAARAKEIAPNPEHIWMDRFAFVGPKEATATILPTESAEDAALSIMKSKNAFFLTRVDKSTANLRESELFARLIANKRIFYGLDALGNDQVLKITIYQGWKSMPKELKDMSGVSFDAGEISSLEAQIARDQATPFYKSYQRDVRPEFYRPINLLPMQATRKANELGWYTLSDNGIFNSIPEAERANLAHLVDGKDQIVKEDSFFLNPAFVVKSARAAPNPLADSFLNYLKRDDVKRFVVPAFRGREAGTVATAADDLEVSKPASFVSRPSLDSRLERASISSLYESPYELYQTKINKLLLQRTFSAGSTLNLDAKTRSLKMMRVLLHSSPSGGTLESRSPSPSRPRFLATSRFNSAELSSAAGSQEAREAIAKVASSFENRI